ncbi:hypothetical protein Taro_045009 [Colocasia esculenta]|uniref:Uncharacterized protein n=1 Tax=Colocasia esculenta TaxID=4460 RepID=A0A843X1X3_COLES|nr:hypothetical protein [Colocasia esculenta]
MRQFFYWGPPEGAAARSDRRPLKRGGPRSTSAFGTFLSLSLCGARGTHELGQGKVELGNVEEVAKMFNTLCNGTHLDYIGHQNATLFTSVTAYCDVPHHRWRASLKGSFISLCAAILLLFFAAVEAYYTAFPKKSSP